MCDHNRLRLRGVDVITAQEIAHVNWKIRSLLNRATTLGRIMFTRDDDLIWEAAHRQKRGERFTGIVHAHQLDVSIGQCVIDLELIVKASVSDEWINRLEIFAAEMTSNDPALRLKEVPMGFT